MVCKHLERIRSENAGGGGRGVREVRGEEKREVPKWFQKMTVEGKLKVLDKDLCYKLTLTKGGPDPDLFGTFFNRTS